MANGLSVVCLDLEGVLVPEIWIGVAKTTGIEKLMLTTRDIPDYDRLMQGRIAILNEHKLTLLDIQNVIAAIDPLPGALDFLEGLRAKTQVVILSDTFTEFARPLMQKLRWPTLFCNTLTVDNANMITGYRLRQPDGKTKAVAALKSIGFRVVAAGDSYNDVGMITTADAGIFFKPPASITREYPAIPVANDYTVFMRMLSEKLG
ncbi:MAG: bifunctional phosphoserine phosphatase/homoserine phosphotransferase ThrH [Spirochaetes bacterium]|nr:bifunctional phosphoserine phosphatase/homoserine phosphotransferase ThrH [Spirochaetota bacterium]